MYRIMGADGKEYGPVTGDQVRHWVAEGRANAQTRARAESEPDWKPLAEFPEFADVAGVAPAVAPPLMSASFPAAEAPGERVNASRRVKGPAIALSITAAINLVFGVWQLVKLTFSPMSADDLNSLLARFDNPQLQEFLRKVAEVATGPMGVVNDILKLVVSGLILFGAIRMFSLRNHTLAFLACVLAMLPCITPCCGIITFPFGIWALVELNKPEVKSQFGR